MQSVKPRVTETQIYDVTYMNKALEGQILRSQTTSAVTKAFEESSNGQGINKCGFDFARYKILLETDYTTV